MGLFQSLAANTHTQKNTTTKTKLAAFAHEKRRYGLV